MTKSYIWNPWRTAESHPDRPAVIVDDRVCDFRQLTTLADEFRRGLVAAGVPDGAVVGTNLPSGPELFALALAALRGGYGFFPVSATSLHRRAALLDMAGARLDVGVDLTEMDSVSRAPRSTLRLLRASAAQSDTAASTTGDASRGGFLVFATSGTTGDPTVVVRHRPWYPYRGVAVISRYAAGVDRGPHVMANSTFHLGTLGPALYALQAGSSVVVMPTWSAEQFRDVVDRHRAESAFVSPNQLADVVAVGRGPDHRMSCLFHGGAPTPLDVKHTAITLLGPILHEYYGTSHGIISEVSAAEWLERPGTAGRPLPGVRVSIVRNGTAARPGELGAIHVRHRTIDVNEAAPPFMDTGDIGYVDRDHYLFVLGRGSVDEADNVVLLEHLIRLLPGVSDAVVRSGGNGTHCFVEYLSAPAPGRAAEVRQLGRRLGLGSLTVTLGVAGAFPRTASGKLRRTGLDAAASSAVATAETFR